MKSKFTLTFQLVAATWLLISKANAAVIVSGFNLTTNSVTFDITGNLPNELPMNSYNILVFANRNTAANPGFSLGNFIGTRDVVFTGTQGLSGRFPVSTGNPQTGDYFYVSFSSLSSGELINGTLTATWSSNVFDPTEVKIIDVYWGSNLSLNQSPITQPSIITGGTLLTTIIVPEPNPMLFVMFGSLIFICLNRKK